MAREHDPRTDPIIALLQTDRERKAIWDRVHPTVLDAESVEAAIRQKKHYLMPTGTVAMVRIKYAISPTEEKYFDIGEATLTSDTQTALSRSGVHAPLDVGSIATFTLDSPSRRDLYESGQGREALVEEKKLAGAFMASRRELLNFPQFQLRLGNVVKVELVTRTTAS